MPYRKIILAKNNIYHILNRGVAETPIFTSTREHQRFLDLIDFYRYEKPTLCFSHYFRLSQEDKEKFMENLRKKEKLVEILAYCLMPNHFHLLLKQLKKQGISKMLGNIENGYVRYFNLRHERLGPLFQSIFKAVRIETDEQFLHASRYIHLNPSSSYLVKIKDLPSYPWSSLPEYLGKRPSLFTKIKPILVLAGGEKDYQKFVFAQAEYQRELDKIKHLSLDNPEVPSYSTPDVD